MAAVRVFAGRSVRAGIAAALILALVGCNGDDGPESPQIPSPAGADTSPEPTETPPPAPSAPARPPQGVLRPGAATDVATGLTTPWGLAFLPDGSALVSERDTALVKQISPTGSVSEVGEVSGVVPGSEGGLMGLAVAPTFAQDPWLYAYFTAESDNRVARMRLETGRLGAAEVIFEGIAKAGIHNGGRIVFGPDGMLYVGTGDASERPTSQDTGSPNGKILRLTPDGGVPADNPFPGSPVWSLGHRNVQGLAFDDAGRLWASEFGQNTWDELNLVQAGQNYGWPEVEGAAGAPGFIDPVVQWSTNDASPSGIALRDGVVFMAALRGARLWVVPVPDGQVQTPEPFFDGAYGRLRTTAIAPDGSLWLVTSNTDGRGNPRNGDDRILRVALA
jgi:glucose/arabinose dehydrogenase